MLQLTGQSLTTLPVTGLTKVKDLERHDGPLLSHFRSDRGSDYLYYWCDCDAKLARWMVLRVEEQDILRLIERDRTLDEVIPSACLDDVAYFVDVYNQRQTITMVALADIPREYRPGNEFVDVPDEALAGELALFINPKNDPGRVLGLPRIFFQVYAIIYAVFIDAPKKYTQIPWQHSFGGKRFYDWVQDRIADGYKPGLEAFEFSSPGFARFSLSREVGDLVVRLMENLENKARIIGSRYGRLERLVARFEKAKGDRGKEIENALPSATTDLMQVAGLGDGTALSHAASPYEGAKLALSFVRRMRKLRKFETDGFVTFPQSFLGDDQ